MTHTKTVASLKDVQVRLASVSTSLTFLDRELVKLQTLVSDAANEIANTPAPAAPAQPTTAKELLDVFKAAMRAPLVATPPKDILKDFSGSMKPAPSTPQPAPMAFNLPPIVVSQMTLTQQARDLLNAGHPYFEAIDKLHKQNPGSARDNIRRAVARAQGR
jgi:hypothetical protein